MEKFNISYSTKNIPLPSRSDYLQRLIEKTEQFLRRMRWKAHFFLNPDTTSFSKETYGFKSTKNPPPIEELKDFEDDMLKMVQSVKFKQVNSPFLNKLKEDTDRIKNEPKLLIAADKTTNFYKLEPSTYNDLLEKNITKSYKKAQPETTQAIHKENKAIATKLRIDDRVDTTADKEAFITLKDHKPNFANKPTCRLINPTKSEIGKVSKKILDRINSTIAKKTQLQTMEKHHSHQPEITLISARQTVNKGDVVTLNCTADGNPAPIARWTRLSDNSNVSMPLTISGKEYDSNYRCTASNSVGSVTRDTSIVVNFAAVIVPLVERIIVEKGDDVTLFCNASGMPPPSVMWTHVPKGRKQYSETWLITDTHLTDLGEYRCDANNTYGHATDAVTIEFEGALIALIIVAVVVVVFS
ncbi:leucine-rich repeats and immunoglobulin-like domains protein 1 [Montipora capricornis]|uniref:leucine-rich repeats and immunoglobulin-like domains protein 1 n=1 Tax=Montipora capricornis TaxID=246305 RepID=UPI0035F17D6D